MLTADLITTRNPSVEAALAAICVWSEDFVFLGRNNMRRISGSKIVSVVSLGCLGGNARSQLDHELAILRKLWRLH